MNPVRAGRRDNNTTPRALAGTGRLLFITEAEYTFSQAKRH